MHKIHSPLPADYGGMGPEWRSDIPEAPGWADLYLSPGGRVTGYSGEAALITDEGIRTVVGRMNDIFRASLDPSLQRHLPTRHELVFSQNFDPEHLLATMAERHAHERRQRRADVDATVGPIQIQIVTAGMSHEYLGGEFWRRDSRETPGNRAFDLMSLALASTRGHAEHTFGESPRFREPRRGLQRFVSVDDHLLVMGTNTVQTWRTTQTPGFEGRPFRLINCVSLVRHTNPE